MENKKQFFCVFCTNKAYPFSSRNLSYYQKGGHARFQANRSAVTPLRAAQIAAGEMLL